MLCLTVLTSTADALAKDPPRKDFSAVDQYRERIPAADGPKAVGGYGDKPVIARLPEPVAKAIETDGGTDAATLRNVVSNSHYGAPQKALPRLPRMAPARPRAGDPPGRIPTEPAARARAGDDRTVGSAVAAATKRIVVDADEGRLPLLVVLLAGITLAASAAAAARRPRRGF